MDDNLFASIMENDKKVSKYRAAPPNLKEATENTPVYTPNTTGESRSQSPQPAQNEVSQTISSHISGNIPKYRICIDSVDKVVEGTMIKSSFIVYRITFTRMSDLQSHGTWKRYKDLSTWYSQLQQRQPELLNHETLKFPATQDTWMGGNQNDPLSEFVLKRKLDLETFLKSLFIEFPSLFKHPNIAEFFELNDFPEEKVSKLASRIIIRELQESTRVNIANKASSAGISGIVLDNTGERALDISWYKYDKTILQNILSKNEVYNTNSAIIMYKNEHGELFSDSKNNITLAELLHFEEENERMIGAHQKIHEERCSIRQEERNTAVTRTT